MPQKGFLTSGDQCPLPTDLSLCFHHSSFLVTKVRPGIHVLIASKVLFQFLMQIHRLVVLGFRANGLFQLLMQVLRWAALEQDPRSFISVFDASPSLGCSVL